MRLCLSLFLLCLFCCQLSAEAADGTDSLLTARRCYTTRRLPTVPPAIDGRLDDPCWQGTGWEGDFRQREPVSGALPSQKTEFKLFYDDAYLYVGIRCWDREPEKIASLAARRDEYSGDLVGIAFDSYFDHRTAFEFDLTAAGVQLDLFILNNGVNWDASWDAVWSGTVAREDSAWTAEMRIPFSQIRFPDKPEQIWGLHLWRWIYRNQEEDNWQYIPKDANGMVHLYGELHGLEGIRRSTGAEILPYLVGKLRSSRPEPGNPFATGTSMRGDAGFDGRLALSSNVMLDLTVNPEFGQVEADPSVMNLTAFETFYVEKRPFFLEGKGILDFQIDDDLLFYSRRIGHAPSYAPPAAPGLSVRSPENSAIIGAVKLTGKTDDGLAIGALESLTAKEYADVAEGSDRSRLAVEPLTNFAVGRLQKEFGRGNTSLGMMLTATDRAITDEQLRVLPSASYACGLDLLHQWSSREYALSVKTLFSTVTGSREALLALQRSPVHNFQRPDASYLPLDPDRRTLSGYGGTVELGKGGGGPWRFSEAISVRSPGLDLNDLGYLRVADLIRQRARIGYVITEPGPLLLNYALSLQQYTGWSFGGETIENGLALEADLQFANFWFTSLHGTKDFPALDTRVLRGGPALRTAGSWSLSAYANTDRRRDFGFETNLGTAGSDARIVGSRDLGAGAWARPTSRILVTANVWTTAFWNTLQYISTQEAAGIARYLLGRLDQRTVGLTLRVDWSLSPNLSLQYYGSPFVSAGTYSALRLVANPRAVDFETRAPLLLPEQCLLSGGQYQIDPGLAGSTDFTVARPDFNFRQFRSNLVLRWQYTEGSTLYLVWSQGRTGSLDDGSFSFGRDLRGLFSIYPDTILLLKLNYWVPL